MGERAMPGITAIRSAPLDSPSVKEISKDRKEEDRRGKFLVTPRFRGQKRNKFGLRLQKDCPKVGKKVSKDSFRERGSVVKTEPEFKGDKEEN